MHLCVCFFQVKWSGAYQDGAGLTLGEEVEQCNAFLSRIAVTTKHMSKAGEKANAALVIFKCLIMMKVVTLLFLCVQDGGTC